MSWLKLSQFTFSLMLQFYIASVSEHTFSADVILFKFTLSHMSDALIQNDSQGQPRQGENKKPGEKKSNKQARRCRCLFSSA